MSIKYIEVSTGQLDSDRADMASGLQKIREQFNRLFEEMQALDAMWEGPAKQTFQAQFAGDCEIAEEICENLAKYIESMENASQEYKKCENDVADIIAAIKI